MSLAPSREADSAIAHAMLCLFATPRISPFLPSRCITSLFSLSFFYCPPARYCANHENNTALIYNHAIMIRLGSTQTPPLVQEDDGAVLIIGSRATPAAILILLGLLLSSSSALAQTTTAQQLGYGPNDKLLIVHADDIGMSHSVNVATIEAFKQGLVTLGRLMVTCQWFPEL